MYGDGRQKKDEFSFRYVSWAMSLYSSSGFSLSNRSAPTYRVSGFVASGEPRTPRDKEVSCSSPFPTRLVKVGCKLTISLESLVVEREKAVCFPRRSCFCIRSKV